MIEVPGKKRSKKAKPLTPAYTTEAWLNTREYSAKAKKAIKRMYRPPKYE